LLETFDRCLGEIDNAQLAPWTRVGRVRTYTRQVDANVSALLGFSVRSADAIVDGAAFCRGSSQAEFLQRLRKPYDNDASFVIIALGRLHEKELLEFDGTWVVGGRLS
jgi:hypothetical protein